MLTVLVIPVNLNNRASNSTFTSWFQGGPVTPRGAQL